MPMPYEKKQSSYRDGAHPGYYEGVKASSCDVESAQSKEAYEDAKILGRYVSRI